MSLHRIVLRRSGIDPVRLQFYTAHRMRIDVMSVEGPDLDTKLFIYQRNVAAPYSDGSPLDMFCAMAGPAELASIPVDTPNPDQGWPFYRLSYAVLDFSSTKQADELWKTVKREAAILVQALNRFATLNTIETFDTDS